MTAGLPPLAGASARSKARGVMAAIACIALFGVSQGMTHPLIALRLEMAGWSTTAIGLNAAMVAIAALISTPFMPRMIGAMGLPAFLTLGGVFSSAMLALFAVWDSYAAWLALRFLQGIAASMLFVGSEAWIVGAADPATRGRTVGLYATVLSLGFAAGPMIVTVSGFEGAAPFLICAALALVCIPPLITAWGDAPPAERAEPGSAGAFHYLRSDPTVMCAVMLFGAIEFGIMGLLPVWGVRTGLDANGASFLVTALVLGNVALQIPLGALADRGRRRAILVFCAVSSLAAAAALPMLAGTRFPLWGMLFVWGGLAAGLYTVALIELGARYSGHALVSANAAVVIAYGIGALAGPLVAGAAMEVIDPHGIAVALAAMALGYLGVALGRGRWRRRWRARGRTAP